MGLYASSELQVYTAFRSQVTMTFDPLTLKMIRKIHVRWATLLNLDFLELFILKLRTLDSRPCSDSRHARAPYKMYCRIIIIGQTDGQTGCNTRLKLNCA